MAIDHKMRICGQGSSLQSGCILLGRIALVRRSDHKRSLGLRRFVDLYKICHLLSIYFISKKKKNNKKDKKARLISQHSTLHYIETKKTYF